MLGQTVDAFDPEPGGIVGSLALQRDSKVVVGGMFLTLAGQSSSRFGRLNPDGSLDTTLRLAAGGDVISLVCLPDGRLLAGGAFTSLGGYYRNRLALVNADDTLDVWFNPNVAGNVFALVALDDGKILVGGGFSNVGGMSQANLARLQPDGKPDKTFTNAANGEVYSMARQEDGRIVVAGSFTTLGGLPRNHIARLNVDGSVDPTFDPNAAHSLQCVAVQPDGRILVAGSFGSVGGHAFQGIARLNSDGTVDSTFNAGDSANGPIYSVALQTDGRILVGGAFGWASGGTSINLCRLNTDGSMDASFAADASYSYGDGVYSVAIQADGRVLVGGVFTSLAGQARRYLGRLNNTVEATSTLSRDGSTITWLRGGTSPEVWRTTFEGSTNGTDWVFLGLGERVAGGWQLSGVDLPSTADVRARGFVSGGRYNGSGWFVETTLALAPRPGILVSDNQFGVRSNAFLFQVTGPVGRSVVVEASKDLVHWSPVTTNLVGDSGIYLFRDEDWTLYPGRFYRARLQ